MRCSITLQGCNICPQAICTADEISNGSSNNSSPGAGPIVGGVIGGIVAIAILTYLVWRFLIKPKRAMSSPSMRSSQFDISPTNGRVEKHESVPLQRRNSTNTVHSIASTVMTRASNIIQIAYIPGVTNRPANGGPDVLVPPVPPMPGNGSEQHYYGQGQVRDSTYSGYTQFSESGNAMGNRSSIASTIYGKQAQVQNPAQAVVRAKPTVVSVKGSGTTPPQPDANMERFANRPESLASNFSMSSTMLNNANTATPVRAQVVKVGNGIKKVAASPRFDDGASVTSYAVSSVESEKEVVTPEMISAMSTPTIKFTPPTDAGPFADPPQSVVQKPSLDAIKEERREDSSSSLGNRSNNPFGDEHTTK